MTAELKQIPTLSYDLIEWLDENIALPEHLQPGQDIRSHVQIGGMRALIDELVAARDAETNSDVSDEDAPSSLEISEDGTLPSVLGSRRVLGPSTPSFQMDIGETE